MGPAPAVAQVRSAVRAVLADAADTVLVACSGGADSVALAAALAFEAPRCGRRAGLVTVDHGLQGGSADVAARVVALGADLGLDPVLAVAVDVGTEGGPEAAARTARYAALTDVARAHGAEVVLGHTLDDQAETVLLGLGRGSGPRSMAGMAAQTGAFLRPLLGLRRSVTESACKALGLPVWTDPHNADPTYQRVRLRSEALPLLEDILQGGVAEALARTAGLLRADVEALDDWAVRAVDTAADRLDVATLAELPGAVRTRVLRAWVTAATGAGAQPLSAERTAAVDALVTDWHGQGPIDLPGNAVVRRAGPLLVIGTHPAR